MENSLEKIGCQDVAQTETFSDSNMMAVIARAAADPNMNVEKMERLLAMQERFENRKAEREFNAAMTKAQAEMPMVIKKSTNQSTNSTYAKLEAVKIAIAPVLKDNGFSLMFSEGKSDQPDKTRVICDVLHDGGHSIQRYMDLSRDDVGMKGSPTKTKVHGEGSTFSYGTRYLTCAIFNVIIIGMDNDGQGGHKPRPVVQSMKQLATQPVTQEKEFADKLWRILKPTVSQVPGWNPKTWDGHQAWLWQKEIMDGGAVERVPNLTVAQFERIIAATEKELANV